MNQKELLKLIAEAAEDSSTNLDLSEEALTSLPTEIWA